MDLSTLMNYKKAWDTFRGNHPKFPAFLDAVRRKGVSEGTEIEISMTFPDGENMKAGIKVRQSDLDLLRTLGNTMR